MDYYFKKITNFTNLLTNNLYNEYNKNKILKHEVHKYKNIFEKFPAIKILNKTENYILKNIENASNSFLINKKIIPIKIYPKTIYKTGKLTKYIETFKKKILYQLCKIRQRFYKDECFFIEKNILKNLTNLENFTEDGLSDFNLYPNLKYIIDIRNIQLIRDTNKYKEYTFEATTVLMRNVEYISLHIKLEKIDNKYKITELNCEKFQ